MHVHKICLFTNMYKYCSFWWIIYKSFFHFISWNFNRLLSHHGIWWNPSPISLCFVNLVSNRFQSLLICDFLRSQLQFSLLIRVISLWLLLIRVIPNLLPLIPLFLMIILILYISSTMIILVLCLFLSHLPAIIISPGLDLCLWLSCLRTRCVSSMALCHRLFNLILSTTYGFVVTQLFFHCF